MSATWLQRLVVAEWWRRLVPVGVAAAVARPLSEAAVRFPAIRRRAEVNLERVLGETDRRDEIPALAAPYLYENAMRWFLNFKADAIHKTSVKGREHAEHVVDDTGRGVIFSFMHIGTWMALLALPGQLAEAGVEYALPVGFGQTAELSGWVGLWVAQGMRYLHEEANQVLAVGSYDRLRDVLNARGVVTLAFDVPGHAPATMLGRHIGLKAGTARLSTETGAPVLPVQSTLRRGRLVVEILPPIEPAATLAETQANLATEMERLILARPEAVDHPTWRYVEMPPAPGAGPGE